MVQFEKTSRSGNRPVLWVVIAVVVVLALVWWARGSKSAAQGNAMNQPRAVAVTTAVARKGDAPVTLVGIGTVTPLHNVTVRSRVDGQLLEVRFKEGQMVKEGDVMALIDPRPFEAQKSQYEGQLAKDKALLSNAQLDLVRYRNLVHKDVLAKQTMDTQDALVKQYQGAVTTDAAQIEAAQLQILYSRITAPVTGRVGLRLVDPGNMVHATDTTGLFVINQVSPISVLFTLPEDNLPDVRERLATEHTLTVAAFDRSMSRKLAEGTLATTDNQIDTATGTVRLRAVFPNADESLFPNQFVNAVLTLKVLHDVILVPAAAVQRGPKGASVFVVGKDNTVQSRVVKTGLAVGQDILVQSGLEAGETVVVDGSDRLRDGAAVSVRNANVQPGK